MCQEAQSYGSGGTPRQTNARWFNTKTMSQTNSCFGLLTLNTCECKQKMKNCQENYLLKMFHMSFSWHTCELLVRQIYLVHRHGPCFSLVNKDTRPNCSNTVTLNLKKDVKCPVSEMCSKYTITSQGFQVRIGPRRPVLIVRGGLMNQVVSLGDSVDCVSSQLDRMDRCSYYQSWTCVVHS